MESIKFIKRIKKYSIISFLVPLIAINSCLLLYKFFGQTDLALYPNYNWNDNNQEYSWDEWRSVKQGDNLTLTNCPKNQYFHLWKSKDGVIISDDERGSISKDEYVSNINKIHQLQKNNEVKTVTREFRSELETRCIKNHSNLYLLVKKFQVVEKILIQTLKNNYSGFAKIENPYLYGEVSISRTARYYPATLIFKPLIILSAFLLILYWKNNINFFNELKKQNILSKFSHKFFYFGILSCIFLILHASFLGLDYESKLFDKARKLIIILFIFFEVIAQIFLTKNLFSFKDKLKNYIRLTILKIKVIFVIIVFVGTIIAFLILAFQDPSSSFKHILEWNYFAFLLFYYLLSRLMWKN